MAVKYEYYKQRMKDGPYKGKSIRELVEFNPYYIRELIDQGIYMPSAHARAKIRHRMQEQPELKVEDPDSYIDKIEHHE